MRAVLLSSALLLGVVAAPVSHIASVPSPTAIVHAADLQDPQSAPPPSTPQQPATQPQPQSSSPQVVIEEHNTTRAWHPSPVWVAIGGLAVAMLVILLVMAMRGSSESTTVVRG